MGIKGSRVSFVKILWVILNKPHTSKMKRTRRGWGKGGKTEKEQTNQPRTNNRIEVKKGEKNHNNLEKGVVGNGVIEGRRDHDYG